MWEKNKKKDKKIKKQNKKKHVAWGKLQYSPHAF
jgi:hypothetical protein